MSKKDNTIIVLNSKAIKDRIYEIRNQKVMLDCDLAQIYGYTTKAFNQQVKNNIERFDKDFMFKLTKKELKDLRSKNLTSSWGGNRYIPNAFTEQGVYMLMTVLKGDLATKQSKTIIRLFKQMKDYIASSNSLVLSNNNNEIVKQVLKNSNEIKQIKSEMATKKDLSLFMKNFVNEHIGNEILLMDGQIVEADVSYINIYKHANKSIYIIDNYIGLKTLALLKGIKHGVEVKVFSDNVGRHLTNIEVNDFKMEYPNINIDFIMTNNKFHDRFIVIDYKKSNEKIYHCGSSSKDAGGKVTAIIELNNNRVYCDMIDSLLKNKKLVLDVV